MNKLLLVAFMLSLGFASYADQGGFEPGKTPPPQHNEDAGYKGSEDTGETPTSLIKDFRQGGYVTLEGYIIKKISNDRFQFRDRSGVVNIHASAAAFQGKTYNAEDKVRVSGKVFGKGENAYLAVSRIDEP